MDNLSARIISKIDRDRTHGASQLAIMGLEGLKSFAGSWQGDRVKEFCEELQLLIEALRIVRPSMAAIANLVERFQYQFEFLYSGTLDEVRASAIEIAEVLVQDTTDASAQTARTMAGLINDHEVLMTHSLSSLIKSVLGLVVDKSVHVVVTESRPGNEGLLLAEYLSTKAIETIYITDAQVGLWVPKADKIVIGADTILADGAVVNKAGTYLLALAAREHDIPVYVGCESYKWSKVSKDQVALEEMDPDELQMPPLDGVLARNIYFDITPAELITAWVSEQGVEREW